MIPAMTSFSAAFIRRRQRRGFSLVEVLVALSIGAVAFFPIITMLQQGLKTNIRQSFWSQARDLGVKNIEEVMALPFEQIGDGSNNIKDVNPPFPRYVSIKNVSYSITIEVKTLSPKYTYRMRNLRGDVLPPLFLPPKEYIAANEIKEVTVTVGWSPTGTRRDYITFPLRSYRADLHK